MNVFERNLTLCDALAEFHKKDSLSKDDVYQIDNLLEELVIVQRELAVMLGEADVQWEPVNEEECDDES